MVLKKSQVPRKVKNSFLELVEKGYLADLREHHRGKEQGK